MRDRRFPLPWTVEDHNDAGFTVKDRSGQALAYAPAACCCYAERWQPYADWSEIECRLKWSMQHKH